VRPRPSVPGSRRESGQVLVIFALGLVALLAATSIAVDLGRFYSERRFLQNAADAAALAASNALIRGASETDARAEAVAVLTRNFTSAPNGITPPLPPGSGNEIYESGFSGSPDRLLEGILISGGSVRVAVRNEVPYTFGRAIGLDASLIGARARTRFDGNLLPIAVRRFVNAPGTSSGTYPCVDNFNAFMDFFATANTACMGTDANGAQRVSPNAGSAFNATTPDNDRANHGPIVEILGQGAQPGNGADFRGFVALDIRNFASASSQLYYNGVTAGTNSNTLKDMEAAWILNGGYPGPMFAPAVTPPDPNNQVATMSGNSSGISIDAFEDRFAPGDEILVAVYPGVVMQIPDFSMSSPGTISAPTTGEVANAGSFRASRNQAFSGTVTLQTVADAGDAANPMVLGQLDGGDPFDYTPNPVTPTMGSGTTVRMEDLDVSGATPGIYSLWLRGEAGSPYLTVKYQPFALKIGTVSRDFTFTSSSSLESAAAVGNTVTFSLNLRRSGSAFGGSVALSLEGLPGATLPASIGAVTFSPASVTPASGSGSNVTLTINTGTMSPGQYQFVVRATGMNGDATPRKVTRLLPITVNVATASAGGNQEYVDITGFAVMRVVDVTSNSVTAYAITEAIADPSDSRLRRGQVARLVPWN
jgi:hypothetical protein